MSTASKYELTWELDSLLPHPESDAFAEHLNQFRADLNSLAQASEQLPAIDAEPAHVETWAEFVEQLGNLLAREEDLHAFVGCHAAADAENQHFQRLEGVLSSLSPKRSQILTNVELALKSVDAGELEAFIKADPRLEQVAFYFEESRENARFRLPKDQELLSAELAVDGIHAWGRLYDRLSGALRIEVMEKGELVRKSPGQVQFDSKERSVRQNNFYAASKAWNTIADTCADALNHISGFRLTRYRRLGLEDHLDAPLRLNRMQRETLEAMWGTATERKGCLKKYFDIKARLLGLEKLTWYDLQAPLPIVSRGTESGELSYDAACDLVIHTFEEFSDELGDFARMAIENRWIEVENRAGKRQGGFCTGLPTKKQSRIFMTFTNTPDSMSTLAHELGHAYHSWVLRDEPLLLQEYPMNLAETASTFAEAVLGDRRLADAESAESKLAILDNMLSDSVAFLMNIHARFLFEDRFHVERRDGELSSDRLSELMLAAQKDAYLDALDPDGWYPGFWISKLHFYISGWPFYNFPYTFGYLLSQGLYALASDAGPDFPQQYRDLLIATGNRETEEAVSSTFGYDLRQPDFWNRSLDIVESRVNEFVRLAEPFV